ncbi:hypothetical protein HMSSN139_46510 [Paenibacillus sp. HMSSN-139]|nr:hypothetical protein HMSSN139_46510 [Paenibacillus sp. HMSSN-139]
MKDMLFYYIDCLNLMRCRMGPVMDSDSKTTADLESSAGKPQADSPQSRWAEELWEMLKTIVIAFVIMLLLNVFVFNLSMVKGQSMQPTLEEQERLFVDKLVYRLGHPKRGEVVVLKDPSVDADRKPFLVKRVVAVPGIRSRCGTESCSSTGSRRTSRTPTRRSRTAIWPRSGSAPKSIS